MWPYPTVIAHRGGGGLAPENTLAALRCGLQHGFRAVEFDVMLAKDGVPVVIHDWLLGRTVAANGRVQELESSELARMDAGAWFGAAFAGEPVPTFERVFRFCRANGIWMNVEIKPAPGQDHATGRAVAESTRRWLVSIPCAVEAAPPLLSSFSHSALLAAQTYAPELARGYLTDAVPTDWRELLAQTGAVALHTNHRTLSPKLASAAKDAGFGLLCYTVNDPLRARELFSWGVDAICTDALDLIGPDFG